jgi:hypothetical protein
MQDDIAIPDKIPCRQPWNKGKLTGPKPPLRPKHVWSIRTKLQVEGRVRDSAMFNLAIDSKLRGWGRQLPQGCRQKAGRIPIRRASRR